MPSGSRSARWVVTALDVSGVALERAAAHAGEAGVDIRWIHPGLLREPSTGH